MNFKTVTVTAPTAEPITLDQAKAQLRLTALQTFDDSYISTLIPVARDRAEQYCNRYFTIQEIKLISTEPMPVGSDVLGYIELPYPDLTSVDAVTYTDTDGAEQTIDGADYTFDSDTARLYPVASWPQAYGFKVTATTAAPVEFEGAKQAMLMLITDMYELRTESVIGASVAENMAVNTLLTQYRVNMGF